MIVGLCFRFSTRGVSAIYTRPYETLLGITVGREKAVLQFFGGQFTLLLQLTKKKIRGSLPQRQT